MRADLRLFSRLAVDAAREISRAAPLALALAACGSTSTPAGSDVTAPMPPASSIGEVGASPSAAAPRPRVEGDVLGTIEVEGFLPASLSIPIGAEDARPIVVATHGNGDRAEWQCEVWSGVFRGAAFILCPTGKLGGESSPGDPRYTYTDSGSLEREIDAGLAALRASKYAPFLDAGPPVYVGFSMGAMMGVSIASRRAADFPTQIWVEGGLEKLTDAALAKFVKSGGKRILFACAEGKACADASKLFADRLTTHGGQGMAVYAGPIGHRYDGPVADAVAAALPGFLADEPRWKRLLPE